MVYEALTDGTWDLWVARPDGSESHRSTNSPGSERSAAWHPRLPFIYFESDGRTIWRVAIDASARATGPPERWLTLPDRLEAASDGIDFTVNGDRILVTLLERASDIWLVELIVAQPGSGEKPHTRSGECVGRAGGEAKGLPPLFVRDRRAITSPRRTPNRIWRSPRPACR